MALQGMYAAARAIQAVFVGMGGSIEVAPEDWPEVRAALEEKAAVWAADGRHSLADAARATVARLDAQEPPTRTGMTKEQ